MKDDGIGRLRRRHLACLAMFIPFCSVKRPSNHHRIYRSMLDTIKVTSAPRGKTILTNTTHILFANTSTMIHHRSGSNKHRTSVALHHFLVQWLCGGRKVSRMFGAVNPCRCIMLYVCLRAEIICFFVAAGSSLAQKWRLRMNKPNGLASIASNFCLIG